QLQSKENVQPAGEVRPDKPVNDSTSTYLHHILEQIRAFFVSQTGCRRIIGRPAENWVCVWVLTPTDC
ncbi:hypothetical protein P4E94_18455, partial [Pontiellaceae bacterium B12219]|nr:hypothetical protein [Pontiellaceae bacterium B12219]